MEDFQYIKPGLPLLPYVKHYWFLKTSSLFSMQVRTVPTGHISLIFHRGKQIFSTADNDLQPKAFLCGHEKSYNDLLYSGQVDMLVVVFHPVGAKAFFNVPVSELNDLNVSVDDLYDAELTELSKVITETAEEEKCVRLIENFLLKRLCQLPLHNQKRINATINLINAGQMNVNTLANVACLSYKQFQRVFSEYVGANPKEFMRTVRFQKALFVMQTRPETSLTQLAFECGYYDQPHLIKEFKYLSGYTPGEYVSICTPFSDYFSWVNYL